MGTSDMKLLCLCWLIGLPSQRDTCATASRQLVITHGPIEDAWRVQKDGINNVLDLAKHGSYWLTNEGNHGEQTSLADQDVEKNLMDSYELSIVSASLLCRLKGRVYLTEGISDNRGVSCIELWSALHGGNGRCCGNNDISKATDDFL